MKMIVAFAAILAVAVALPHRRSVDDFSKIAIVRETPSNYVGLDNYKFAYEQTDGQKRDESAQIETDLAAEKSILRVQGSYSWVNPEDGQTYTVIYIADENGFQPQGAHLPK